MNYVVKTEVLKEPRGFIKIIQFLFSILAFACLVDWRGHLSFEVDCKGDKKIIQKTFQYPFAMDEVKLEVSSIFLDASMHLYKRLFPSVRPSVGPSPKC